MPTTSLLDERRLDAAVKQWARECGSRLQTRRKLAGWNQSQLANVGGVRTTSVSKFELGQVMPKESVRLALACALCCEVVDIWPPLNRHYVMNVARHVEVAAA